MDQTPTTPADHPRSGPSRVGAVMDVPLRLRVTRDTADAIVAAAAAAGETDASWVRGAIARVLDRGAADRQRVARYGGGGPDAAAMTALRMQLHELGGLLTQGAKQARVAGLVHIHADAEATLAAIREAITTVASWQRERAG
jgi:hypothetical protein